MPVHKIHYIMHRLYLTNQRRLHMVGYGVLRQI
nr:MAG TPA_asm: hypothetical protein [Caudoviricetes sp.]